MAQRESDGSQTQTTMMGGLRLLSLVAGLLFLPQVMSCHDAQVLDWPKVRSGDEPHYLLILNSLISDGDLDLADDYASAHRGGHEAGEKFRNTRFHHHTTWFDAGQRVLWYDKYDGENWRQDEDGRWQAAVLQPGLPGPPGVEYSLHSFGQAILLAPFTLPFAGTVWVERIALLMGWVAIVAAMFIFRWLLVGKVADSHHADLITAMTFLSTPLWHYSRAFFSEPYMVLLIVAAYALIIRKNQVGLAGAIMGLGALLKPTFLLLGIPAGIQMLYERRFKDAVLYALGPIAGVAGVMASNHLMFGDVRHTSQPVIFGSFIEGGWGLLLSLEHGLFLFAPAAVLAVYGWIIGWHQLAWARSMLFAVIGYFLLHAGWYAWEGGYCYGPRFLVPTIPLLFVGLIPVLPHRKVLFAVAAIGVLCNALGAIPYSRSWGHHPLVRSIERSGLL